MRSTRLGRFEIPMDEVYNRTPMVTRIMGACAILRAECLMYKDMVLYHASSRHFQEVADGEMLPMYRWYLSDSGDFGAESMGYE